MRTLGTRRTVHGPETTGSCATKHMSRNGLYLVGITPPSGQAHGFKHSMLAGAQLSGKFDFGNFGSSDVFSCLALAFVFGTSPLDTRDTPLKLVPRWHELNGCGFVICVGGPGAPPY